MDEGSDDFLCCAHAAWRIPPHAWTRILSANIHGPWLRMMRRHRLVAGLWFAAAVSAMAATNVPDYTPSQWSTIDVLRRSASQHADAQAGKVCGWRTAEPNTPPDMVGPETKPVGQPALRDRLMAMLKEDQASRDVALAVDTPASNARVGYADERHRKALIAIVDEYGLPTTAMVGEGGVWAMFYLSVHADEDIALQQRILGLMQQAAKTNAIPAYLPDFFLSVRRNVPMDKPYAEVYHVDRASHGKAKSMPSTPADPKSCFASRREAFAEEWLRDHLPHGIAGP